MARPIADIVEQIRGSLDYYRAQPGSTRLLRVTSRAVGRSPRTRGAAGRHGRRARRVGDPARAAHGRRHRVPDERVEDSTPTCPCPPGWPSAGSPPEAHQPRRRRGPGRRGPPEDDPHRRGRRGAAAPGPRRDLVDPQERGRHGEGPAQPGPDPIASLTKEKESLSAAESTQNEVDELQGQVETVLATDISWARMLQEIARTIPNDTWLTAFQGTSANGPGRGERHLDVDADPHDDAHHRAGACRPRRRPRRPPAAAAAATRVGRWRPRRHPHRRRPVAPRRSRSSVSTSPPSPRGSSASGPRSRRSAISGFPTRAGRADVGRQWPRLRELHVHGEHHGGGALDRLAKAKRAAK